MKQDNRRTKDAVYVVEDLYMHEKNHQIPSGYDLDARGAKYPNNIFWNRGYTLETDDSLNANATLSRRFMPIREGRAGLNFIFSIERGDGFFIEFLDTEDKPAFTLTQKNDMFYWNETRLAVEASKKTHSMTVEFDIEKKKALVCFGGKYVGTYCLLSENIARYIAGYRNGAKGKCVLKQTHLHINYIVNDRNEVHADGNLAYGWELDKQQGTDAYVSYYYEGVKHYTNVMTAEAGKNAVCRRSFDKADGNICFEIKYLTKTEDKEGVSFSLTADGKDIVAVSDTGTKLLSPDGELLRKHNPYVWQTLNVMADTNTHIASISLNGKKCGEFAFDKECCGFDGIKLSYSPENGGIMKFSDVFVYEIQPEPEDYPKPPVLPEKDDRYFTGMNICSLWRHGEHVGWDAISAFKDNLTYLGFYDEGLREVADWEIKWMAEHGVDCEFYCWYASQTKAPNMKTMLSDAIHNGHFKAKYADYMKLALIWEAGAGCPASPSEVEKYYIPYFEDYFFTDPRYFQIDGVAIMAIYNIEKVARDLGGYDKVREVVELLRASVKRCGYRDLAILTCGEPSENRKFAGVDSVYAYNWGHYSYDPDYQKSRMQNQIDSGILHVVPTVSVGYNDVAWRKARYPMLECEDMKKVLDWFKSDLLPSYSNLDEQWKKKLIMLSTWNEYGEGTYMCPNNLNGFGYLNEVRKALTKNGDAYESDVPSEKVLDRLGYMYPKGRRLLSALLYTSKECPEKLVEEYRFDTPEAMNKIECLNDVELSFEDGKVCGKANANDPQIIFDVDIDAQKVDGIGIKFVSAAGNSKLNRENPITSPVQMFFMREEDAGFSSKRIFEVDLMAPDKSLVMLTKENPEWNGRITRLRIDPTPAKGIFEIESLKTLSFDDGKIRYKTFVDNAEYDCHFRTKMVDGKLFISFEPLRHIHVLTRTYFEWDDEEQTLMIKSYNDKTSYWTMGKDTALVDGKTVKLPAKLELYDGLPYLPLDEFCMAAECEYSVDGDRIDIKTCINKI